MYEVDCSPGQSGAPILLYNDATDKVGSLIGVHIGCNHFTDKEDDFYVGHMIT